MRILFVEDEDNLRKTVKMNLEMEGYEVVATGHGREALQLFKSQHFDLILLDVMLPEIDGFQICEQIRLTNPDVPIIFLTAKDTGTDRITGLKRGADDYLTKPFHLEELLLRIGNLLRRRATPTAIVPDEYSFGDNKVNFRTFEAEGVQGKFNLTRKEAMLLKLLIERKGEVVSRHHILQAVWGYDVYPSTRTIDNFILAFRKYFEKDPRNPRFFHSVRGVGYKFTDES
ncbi:MAG: DNA-binding response regulator [Saprospiraceae bacterium]|nr:MAG: DNA-binding response regulator [Saprospiraceae bacterium]